MSKRNLIVALVAVAALSAGVAAAQVTDYEIRQGTVLHVDGNHLFVKMADGSVRDAEVPSDFMFEVDGKMVPVTALKPGTKLTQTIKTTTTPTIVESVEIREAEVVQRKGQTLIIRNQEGKLRMFDGIPEGFTLYRNGKPVPVEALAGGDRVTAHIVHKETKIVTEEEMNVAGMAPKAPPKAKPAARPAPAPKPAPAPVLPKTASELPLVGLAGLLALVIGLGIAVVRR